mgnify:FL=1
MKQPEPKAPPFPVGTKLRYRGTQRVWASPALLLLGPGIEVVIARVEHGLHGTGRVLHTDDDGYEVVDKTRDGRSVWINARGQGRIIWPDSAGDWEVVAPALPARVVCAYCERD